VKPGSGPRTRRYNMGTVEDSSRGWLGRHRIQGDSSGGFHDPIVWRDRRDISMFLSHPVLVLYVLVGSIWARDYGAMGKFGRAELRNFFFDAGDVGRRFVIDRSPGTPSPAQSEHACLRRLLSSVHHV
jgi:hypothetical protein